MKRLKLFILTLIIALGLVMLTGCVETETQNNTTQEQYEIITVTDKWIKRTDDKDLYMIGTENEVFKIQDFILIGKWNSSDIYNKIKIGKSYKITTTGIRSGFLSMYRNINTIEEVKE